mgnify:CR=1 FL=1
MNENALTTPQQRSITDRVATRYGMTATALQQTLTKTIFPKSSATNEQVAALLIVADQYDLNPFTKEIYAFPQGGGIVPIVGVDGWYKLLHRDKELSGVQVTFAYVGETDKLYSSTARIHKKGWEHPVEVTELMKECERNTPAWKNQPHRMLRHRALAQCIRIACGLSGIYMEEEAVNWADVDDVTEAKPAKASPAIDIVAAKKVAKDLAEANPEIVTVPDDSEEETIDDLFKE